MECKSGQNSALEILTVTCIVKKKQSKSKMVSGWSRIPASVLNCKKLDGLIHIKRGTVLTIWQDQVLPFVTSVINCKIFRAETVLYTTFVQGQYNEAPILAGASKHYNNGNNNKPCLASGVQEPHTAVFYGTQEQQMPCKRSRVQAASRQYRYTDSATARTFQACHCVWMKGVG